MDKPDSAAPREGLAHLAPEGRDDCPATALDRATNNTTQCVLLRGHSGKHDDGAIEWDTPKSEPEGLQDLTDAEIAWREKFWRASSMATASLDGLRLLAEVKRHRAQPADAAPLDARPDGFRKAGLAQIRLALETAAQVGEIYFQSNALAKGAGERITAALVQLAFLEKQSPAAAASLEVEALDALRDLMASHGHGPDCSCGSACRVARAVLRRSGRHA